MARQQRQQDKLARRLQKKKEQKDLPPEEVPGEDPDKKNKMLVWLASLIGTEP